MKPGLIKAIGENEMFLDRFFSREYAGMEGIEALLDIYNSITSYAPSLKSAAYLESQNGEEVKIEMGDIIPIITNKQERAKYKEFTEGVPVKIGAEQEEQDYCTGFFKYILIHEIGELLKNNQIVNLVTTEVEVSSEEEAFEVLNKFKEGGAPHPWAYIIPFSDIYGDFLAAISSPVPLEQQATIFHDAYESENGITADLKSFVNSKEDAGYIVKHISHLGCYVESLLEHEKYNICHFASIMYKELVSYCIGKNPVEVYKEFVKRDAEAVVARFDEYINTDLTNMNNAQSLLYPLDIILTEMLSQEY